MLFLGVTGALLLTAGLIGYGAFVVASRLRRRWVAAILGVVCACALLIASAIVYLMVGETPANNERIGSEQRLVVEIREVQVQIRNDAERRFSLEPAALAQESLGLGRRTIEGSQPPVVGQIEVRAPTVVTPREDFSLALSISSRRPLPHDERAVRLSAPRSAEVRTLDVCTMKQENPLAVCSTPVENRFQVAWDVTPTEPGQLLFTIGVPIDLMPHSGLNNWQAVAIGQWGSGGRGESPVMSSSSPSATWRGVSVDLLTGQLRVPVTVADTLGVSRSAYNGLALIGTLLSALLGSGWLWKLLEWWRARSISRRTSPGS